MGTFYSDRIPVGTRVVWTREMYRVRFANRPTDRGVVVENDGDGFVSVKPDHAPDTVVRGPGSVFRPERV